MSEIEIIVADDDPDRSARRPILEMVQSAPVTLRYVESGARNISVCRNICLGAAMADWIAFIDDDQTAEPDWLHNLIEAAEKFKADAVKSYVRGVYPSATPNWVKVGGAYTYDYGPNGAEVRFGNTGGILFRRTLPGSNALLFDEALGLLGGEDVDFFIRYKANGGRLISCRDAIANEMVPSERTTSRYLQKRWRRHGHIIVRVLLANTSGVRRALSIVKSMIGVIVTSSYPVIRIVHPAAGCWMFTKFWYHVGVLECTLGIYAPHHE